jgi:hypothetical protein
MERNKDEVVEVLNRIVELEPKGTRRRKPSGVVYRRRARSASVPLLSRVAFLRAVFIESTAPAPSRLGETDAWPC